MVAQWVTDDQICTIGVGAVLLEHQTRGHPLPA